MDLYFIKDDLNVGRRLNCVDAHNIKWNKINFLIFYSKIKKKQLLLVISVHSIES